MHRYMGVRSAAFSRVWLVACWGSCPGPNATPGHPDAYPQSTKEVGIWYSSWYQKRGSYVWSLGYGIGSSRQLLGDATGDGLSDAVVYFGNTGTWFVAPSDGTSFLGAMSWISGHGIGSSQRMLADVNGDGKADAVVYFGDTGTWFVGLSDGTSFSRWGTTSWITGHGIASSQQIRSDVNGDDRAD